MHTDKKPRFAYLCLSVFICGPICFPAQAQDVHEIIRRAFEQNQRAQRENYTFLQRQHIRIVDGKGKVKSEKTVTEDVMFIDGSPYRRVVERNDKPLTPDEQKAEEERLRRSDEERRKETPAQRQARIAEWRRRQDERNAPYREVPDAFDFKIAGEETVDGTPAWIIDAMPKPGYKPKASGASILSRFQGRLWIAKSDYGVVRMDAETLGTVGYRGILFRLSKGSRLHVEMVKVNGDVWMPKIANISLSGKVLLLVGLHGDAEFSFRDYKKFQAESRVVSTAEK
jgi:hypothetical protein